MNFETYLIISSKTRTQMQLIMISKAQEGALLIDKMFPKGERANKRIIIRDIAMPIGRTLNFNVLWEISVLKILEIGSEVLNLMK